MKKYADHPFAEKQKNLLIVMLKEKGYEIE